MLYHRVMKSDDVGSTRWTELVIRHRCVGQPIGQPIGQAIWCVTPDGGSVGWARWRPDAVGHWIVDPLVRQGAIAARAALDDARSLGQADRVRLPSRHSQRGAGHVLLVDTDQQGRYGDDGRRVSGHRFTCPDCRCHVPVKGPRMQAAATDAARRGERSVLV